MVQKRQKSVWVVGVDEVGRGPLAGPVHVCAVAMPLERYKKMRWARDGMKLTDSKKMTPTSRERWEQEAKRMVKDNSLKVAVASQSASMIDKRGIAACIRSCIARALQRLDLDPSECVVLLDGGLCAPILYTRQQTVVRGDLHHKIISLASVIAKVRRDTLMKKLHQRHPQYVWTVNKGYGTKAHIAALKHHGNSPYHRKSFITKVF